MKKFFAAICALMFMISGPGAFAENIVPELDPMLFMRAKEALVLFDIGDYEGAASLLGFEDSEELKKFMVGNFLTLGGGTIEQPTVQTTVSVACWLGDMWMLALPLYEPAAPEIDTLVLTISPEDNTRFNGYVYALWGDVELQLSMCDYVIWNEEYIENDLVIYQDN